MAGQKKHQVAVMGSGNWYDLLYKYKLFKTTNNNRGLIINKILTKNIIKYIDLSSV